MKRRRLHPILLMLAGLTLLVVLASRPVRADDRVKPLVKQSIQAWEKGEHQRAFKLLERAVGIAPADPELRYNLGVMALALGDTARAETEFTTVLQSHPKHANTLYNLGKLRLVQGKVPQGIELLEAAAKAQPEDPSAALEVVVAEVSRQRLDAAWTRALSIQPRTPAVHSMLAFVAMRRGDGPVALDHAETAQRAEPAVQRHRLVLAQALIANGRLDEASEKITIAERNSETPRANIPYLRALIAFLRLQFPEAKAQLAQAHKMAPGAFSPGNPAFDSLAFPMRADRHFLTAMADLDDEIIPTARLNQLNVSPGCDSPEVAAQFLRLSQPIDSCHRGGDNRDVDVTIKNGRFTRVRAQTRDRVGRCLEKVLQKGRLATKASCKVRVRVGHTLVQ